ncbi:MAG: hypothetical protein HWN67_01175 [Candidatus Helarchaeota archaeon]|nr:hypothetical protein [Candidatus Helarchaeota archaeon]
MDHDRVFYTIQENTQVFCGVCHVPRLINAFPSID